jgi:dihydrofolate reductase
MKYSQLVCLNLCNSVYTTVDDCWDMVEYRQWMVAMTLGGALLMGRRTWERARDHLAPNSLVLVLSRNRGYEMIPSVESGVGFELDPRSRVMTSIALAKRYVTSMCSGKELYIVGGSEILRQTFVGCYRFHLMSMAVEPAPIGRTFPIPSHGVVSEFKLEHLSYHRGHPLTPSHTTAIWTRRGNI